MKHQDNQHFSHHHLLVSHLKLNEGEKLECNGCEELMYEPFHGCISCNYYIHDHCLNYPRSLQHPSHPSHPLTLQPKPTYSTRSFTCNACGSEGKAFSYGCAHCEFDLHLKCSSLPTTLIHEKDRHELKLIFNFPYNDENSIFECSTCYGTVERSFWRYYCAYCDFGMHLNCAMATKGAREEPIDDQVKSKNPNIAAQQANYDAQIELEKNHQANLLVLNALDNAGDYVGSSHKRYYHY